MADGRIVIDVIMDDGDIKKGVANLDSLDGASKKAGMSLKSMVGAGVIIKGVTAAMGVLKDSVGDAVSRFDTLNNSTRVFQNMGFSIEETKQVMENLKTSLQGLPTPLDMAVKSVQLLASSTGDLGKSQEIFNALNNGILGFGGTTEQVENAVTQLSQAFSNGKIDAETWNSMINSGLGPALNALAKEMGKTTGELKAGLSDGSISVQEFQDRLIKLNKEGGGGLESLEKIAKDAMDGIGTGFANMKTAITRGLANVVGKVNEFVQTLSGKSIGENITEISKMIDSAFTGMSNALDTVFPYIEKFINFIKDNKTEIVSLAKAVGAGIVVFEGIMGIVSIFNTVKTAITGVSTAFKALTAVMAANPFTIIVTAISALAALFVYLWQTNEQFRTKITEIWTAISNFLTPVIQTIVTTIQSLWGGLVTWWGENGSSIFQTIIDVWNNIVAFVQPIITEVVSFIMDIWGNLTTWWSENGASILQAAQTVWNGVMSAIQTVINFLMPFIQTAWEVIKGVTSVVWDVIKNVIATVWDAIKAIVTTALGVIQGIIQVVTGAINGDWSAVWEGIKQIFSSVWEGIKSLVEAAINFVKNIIDTVLTATKNVVDTVLNGIKNVFVNILEGIKSSVNEKIEAVKDIFNSLGKVDLFDIGKNIIQGLIDGIGSMARAVWDKVSGIANDIKDAVSGALGIHSPSRWMRDMIGKNMMLGWEIGLDRNGNLPLKALDKMVDNLKNNFDLGSIQAETLLSVGFNGSSGMGSVVNNADNRTDNYQVTIHNHLENPDLSTINSIEETSEQLAILTERQMRGRL